MPHVHVSPSPESSGHLPSHSDTLPQPQFHPVEGRGNRTCYVGWSPKLDRDVVFGSRLEFFHWLLIESTPEIQYFCEYYPSVPLESRDFVFDVWLHWRDGRQECRAVVMSTSYLGVDGPPLNPAEWAVLACWARDRGYHCTLITEQHLAESMRRINNWRRMLPFVKYARDNPEPQLERAVLGRMQDVGDLPMRELTPLQEEPGDTEVTAVVAKFLHAGKLTADLDTQHFGPNLMLHRPAA